MITYFDTSAIVPLMIDEATSEHSLILWNATDEPISSVLVYVETRAALAAAFRSKRLNKNQFESSKELFEVLYEKIMEVQVTHSLLHRASELSELLSLRSYDAVHLASAETVGDDECIFATYDNRLSSAANNLGLFAAPLTS